MALIALEWCIAGPRGRLDAREALGGVQHPYFGL